MMMPPSNSEMNDPCLVARCAPTHGSRTSNDALKLLALDLLSPVRHVEQAQLDALTEDDWQEMMRMARQHRFAPMMRWQLRHAHAHLRVPAHINQVLADELQAWTLHNLAVQRELLRVHHILEASGIPHVALKGAHLAFAVYPQLALRPLRDIDILVPANQAADAYTRLVEGGLIPSKRHWRSLLRAATFAHSLPHLHSPCNTINVDIHRRMMRMHALKDPSSDPSCSPAFWSSLGSMTVQGAHIPVTGPETLLLHLAAHAALEHHFDNGPLLLSDIAFLTHARPIDWHSIWPMAERVGATRALSLALALSRRYVAAPSIPASTSPDPADRPSEALVDLAAMALLAPPQGFRDIRLLERLRRHARTGSWMQTVWRTMLPPRETIAAQFDSQPNSVATWIGYPKRWWGLLRHESLVSLLHGSRRGGTPHRQRAHAVAQWVDGTSA